MNIASPASLADQGPIPGASLHLKIHQFQETDAECGQVIVHQSTGFRENLSSKRTVSFEHTKNDGSCYDQPFTGRLSCDFLKVPDIF